LAGFIVMLAFRMRLSRRRIQELLESLFGLELSVGLIDQTIRETARLVSLWKKRWWRRFMKHRSCTWTKPRGRSRG
jgi:hypothetical protein